MKAAGCAAWHDIDELAVMGLTEVITHLPRLMRLRARLRRRILEWRPDVFIGVDYKEFNLGLAKQLKRAGLATVQYVSPQVWAWRQGRVRTIGESVDLVLCLFPFEPDFYREHGVRAAFVGHPLADQIPLRSIAPRRAPSSASTPTRACSRCCRAAGAVKSKSSPMSLPAPPSCWPRAFRGLVCIAPMVTPALRDLFAARCAALAPHAQRAHARRPGARALAAADVVLVASGTATLETALFKRPMVVAYKLGAITAFLLRTLGLVKIKHFSQPNLLAGKELVPEFFQEAAIAGESRECAGALARASRRTWRGCSRNSRAIHARLRCDGADRAAAEVGRCSRRARMPP